MSAAEPPAAPWRWLWRSASWPSWVSRSQCRWCSMAERCGTNLCNAFGLVSRVVMMDFAESHAATAPGADKLDDAPGTHPAAMSALEI